MNSRAAYIQTANYYSIFILLGMINASLGLMLPSLAARTHVTLSQVSLLFFANALGYFLGSFLGGRMYDRLPGNRVLIGVMLCSGAVMVSIPLISVFWFLPIVFGFLGVMSGGIDSGINTMLIWTLKTSVGPFMNGLHLSYGVGTFLIPLMITGMLQLSGAGEKTYWVLAFLVLPLVLWLSRLASPTNPHEATAQQKLSSHQNAFVLLILLFVLFGGAQAGYSGWIYSYGLTLKGATVASAAFLTSLYWGGVMLSRLLCIPLAIRVRPQTLLQSGLLLSLLGVVVVLILPEPLPGIWIGTFCLGFGSATFYPIAFTWVGKYVPVSGGSTGWYLAGGGLGMMVVPWVIGQFFESVGPLFTIYTTAGILVAAFLLFNFIVLTLAPLPQQIPKSGETN